MCECGICFSFAIDLLPVKIHFSSKIKILTRLFHTGPCMKRREQLQTESITLGSNKTHIGLSDKQEF